jgi:hypothetical protein
VSEISVYPATETPSSVCDVVAVDDVVDVLDKSGFASFVVTPTPRHNGHEFRPEASH